MPVTDNNRAARRRANMISSVLEVLKKIGIVLLSIIVVLAVAIGTGVFLAKRATAKAIVRMKALPQPMRVSELTSEQLVQLVEVYDPDYYSHNGVSTHALHMTTITQRIVQQYYFDDYQAWLEWLPSGFDAWALNRVMPKDDQLRLFINTVPLGTSRDQDVRGFQQAARMYFDQRFTDLSPDEYLQILAMVGDPDKYHIQSEAMVNIEHAKRLKRFLDGKCKRTSVFDDELVKCAK